MQHTTNITSKIFFILLSARWSVTSLNVQVERKTAFSARSKYLRSVFNENILFEPNIFEHNSLGTHEQYRKLYKYSIFILFKHPLQNNMPHITFEMDRSWLLTLFIWKLESFCINLFVSCYIPLNLQHQRKLPWSSIFILTGCKDKMLTYFIIP